MTQRMSIFDADSWLKTSVRSLDPGTCTSVVLLHDPSVSAATASTAARKGRAADIRFGTTERRGLEEQNRPCAKASSRLRSTAAPRSPSMTRLRADALLVLAALIW